MAAIEIGMEVGELAEFAGEVAEVSGETEDVIWLRNAKGRLERIGFPSVPESDPELFFTPASSPAKRALLSHIENQTFKATQLGRVTKAILSGAVALGGLASARQLKRRRKNEHVIRPHRLDVLKGTGDRQIKMMDIAMLGGKMIIPWIHEIDVTVPTKSNSVFATFGIAPDGTSPVDRELDSGNILGFVDHVGNSSAVSFYQNIPVERPWPFAFFWVAESVGSNDLDVQVKWSPYYITVRQFFDMLYNDVTIDFSTWYPNITLGYPYPMGREVFFN